MSILETRALSKQELRQTSENLTMIRKYWATAILPAVVCSLDAAGHLEPSIEKIHTVWEAVQGFTHCFCNALESLTRCYTYTQMAHSAIIADCIKKRLDEQRSCLDRILCGRLQMMKESNAMVLLDSIKKLIQCLTEELQSSRGIGYYMGLPFQEEDDYKQSEAGNENYQKAFRMFCRAFERMGEKIPGLIKSSEELVTVEGALQESQEINKKLEKVLNHWADILQMVLRSLNDAGHFKQVNVNQVRTVREAVMSFTTEFQKGLKTLEACFTENSIKEGLVQQRKKLASALQQLAKSPDSSLFKEITAFVAVLQAELRYSPEGMKRCIRYLFNENGELSGLCARDKVYKKAFENFCQALKAVEKTVPELIKSSEELVTVKKALKV